MVKASGEPNRNELARKIGKGIDQTTINRIMNEQMSPTIDKVDVIARYFAVPLWALFVEGMDMENTSTLVMPRTNKPLSDVESRLVTMWSQLPQDAQTNFLNALAGKWSELELMKRIQPDDKKRMT